MNNSDQEYDKLIGKIRSMQPVLDEPDKFSKEIMDSIRSSPTIRANRVLKVVSWVSSIAALFLIVLLFSEQPIAEDSTLNNVNPNYVSLSENKSFSKENDIEDQIDCLIQQKQERQRKREFFYSEIADKIKRHSK